MRHVQAPMTVGSAEPSIDIASLRMTQALRFDISQGLVAVVLSQPARGNPFDQHLCAELCAIANECSEHPQVCAVLIRAEGKYFSVGADLKWMSDTRAGLPRLLKDATSKLHMAISRLARADAPVVIAVHGLAAGRASALTAMADFALAGTAAKFYAAYNRIGFVADGGGSYSFAAPGRQSQGGGVPQAQFTQAIG